VIHSDKKKNIEFGELDPIREQEGNLLSQTEEDKLMRLVLEGDKEKLEEGKLIEQSINQSIFSFNASDIFENLVNNFSVAQEIYGESFLRVISGESMDSLKRNIKIPEFQRKLKDKISSKIGSLEDENLIDEHGIVTEYGNEVAAIKLYMDELNELESKGLIGEKINKKLSRYGERKDTRNYKKGDRYKDLALKKSIRQSIRRGHNQIEKEDLRVFERESRGKISVLYALDSSGSMKGRKIGLCKKAGVALAYNAINEHDKAGLLVFGEKVEIAIAPTQDLMQILRSIIKIKAKRETNFVDTIKNSINLLADENGSKHLMLISDGLANVGSDDPKRETLNAVEEAVFNGITISFVGINMDEEGEKLAKKIVEIGNGRLYVVNDLEELDYVILNDYYSI